MKKNKSDKIIFGDALGNGMKTAMINGITGGMTGGIMGGIQGMRTGVQYKRVFRKIQKDLGGSLGTMEAQQFKINNPQSFLEKFSDTYYRDYIYKENTELEYNPKCKTNAKTFYIDKENNLVKFGPSAFGPVHQPDYELYFTMGQEYIHVAHNMNGLYSNKFGEYTAYMWEVNQMKAYGFNQKYIAEVQNNANKYFIPPTDISHRQNIKALSYQINPNWGLPTAVPFPKP